MEPIYLSNCCGERVYPEGDVAICPDCKEWCDPVSEEEEETN